MSADWGGGEPGARPLFVVGTARSGSTLLAKMLDAHPRVNLACDPFLPLFRLLRDSILRSSPGFIPGEPLQDFYHQPGRRARLQALLQADLSLPFDREGWRGMAAWAASRLAMENPELEDGLGSIDGADYRRVFVSALDLVARRGDGGEAWAGFKEVWVIDFLPALARAFAQARFVVINRDPRGMLSSMLQLALRDPDQMAHPLSYLRHWRKQAACLRHFRDLSSLTGRLLALRYEDLVGDPAGQAMALCDFLEVEPHEAMLNPLRYRGRGEGGWAGNAASGQDLSRIEAAHARSWERLLEPGLRRLTELLCWPDMELCGYLPLEDDPTRLPADPETWRAFLAQNRGCFSWRSDLGEPAFDFGAELVRRLMLEPGGEPVPRTLVERAFLFHEVYEELRCLVAGRRVAKASASANIHRGE